jgi:hypothetical protein
LHISTDPWVWIGVFFTLAVLSFLYKDNPFYKLAEHAVVGVSIGYSLVFIITLGLKPRLVEPLLAGEWWYVFPGIVGILYLTRFIRKYSWISRWPIAFAMGIGAGLALGPVAQMYIVVQTRATMIPLFGGGMTIIDSLTAIVIVFGTLAGLAYFFFSKEHKGTYGKFTTVGIWILMIGFGATFGYTVMGRISLFIGRVQFLMGTWLGIQL